MPRCDDPKCPCNDFLAGEDWRRACEARYLLSLKAAKPYLRGVRERRGNEAMLRLIEDAKRERDETNETNEG